MRDTAARRSTAVAVCLGVISVGLSAALLALTLPVRLLEQAGTRAPR